jgi:hypothetical protein
MTLVFITRPITYYFLNKLAPKIRVSRNNTTKRKKRNLAIEAAPAAMPVNPNTAAISATMKNVNAQRNMSFDFKV